MAGQSRLHLHHARRPLLAPSARIRILLPVDRERNDNETRHLVEVIDHVHIFRTKIRRQHRAAVADAGRLGRVVRRDPSAVDENLLTGIQRLRVILAERSFNVPASQRAFLWADDPGTRRTGTLAFLKQVAESGSELLRFRRARLDIGIASLFGCCSASIVWVGRRQLFLPTIPQLQAF